MAAYSGASKKKEPHSYKRIQAELKEDVFTARVLWSLE